MRTKLLLCLSTLIPNLAFAEVPAAFDPARMKTQFEKKEAPEKALIDNFDAAASVAIKAHGPLDSKKKSKSKTKSKGKSKSKSKSKSGHSGHKPYSSNVSEDKDKLAKNFDDYEDAVDESNLGGATFTVERIEYTDGTTDAILEDVNLAKHGKKINFLDLKRTTTEMESRYRSEGFYLTKIIVGPQSFNKNKAVIKLHRIKGKIGKVYLDPKSHVNQTRHFIERNISTLQNATNLDDENFSKPILLIKDIPGATVSSVFVPSQQTGSADLMFHVDQKQRDMFVSYNNRGNQYVGPGQMQAGINFYSILGPDQLSVTAVTAFPHRRQLKQYAADHMILGPGGMRLHNSLSLSRSRPQGTMDFFSIEGNSAEWQIDLSIPTIRTVDENFNVRYGFYINRSTNDLPAGRLFTDKMRVVFAGAEYDNHDSYRGLNKLSLMSFVGLPVLGSTPYKSRLKSRASGHSDFVKFKFNASRLQNVTETTYFYMAAVGQVSFSKLLSSEQFGVGGTGFGRAYDSSEITGDQGYAIQFEVRRDLKPKGTIVKWMQPYAYLDTAKIWNKESRTQAKHDQASSAGVGARVEFKKYAFIDAVWAKPLSRIVTQKGNKSGRLFVSVTFNFS